MGLCKGTAPFFYFLNKLLMIPPDESWETFVKGVKAFALLILLIACISIYLWLTLDKIIDPFTSLALLVPLAALVIIVIKHLDNG